MEELTPSDIPNDLWVKILDKLPKGDLDEFKSICREYRDTPVNQIEKKWMSFIGENPSPSRLAIEIYNTKSFKWALIIVRRLDPRVRIETVPQDDYGKDLSTLLLTMRPEEMDIIHALLPPPNNILKQLSHYHPIDVIRFVHVYHAIDALRDLIITETHLFVSEYVTVFPELITDATDDDIRNAVANRTFKFLLYINNVQMLTFLDEAFYNELYDSEEYQLYPTEYDEWLDSLQ